MLQWNKKNSERAKKKIPLLSSAIQVYGFLKSRLNCRSCYNFKKYHNTDEVKENNWQMLCVKLIWMRSKADLTEATNAKQQIHHSSWIFSLRDGYIKNGCQIRNAEFFCAFSIFCKKNGNHNENWILNQLSANCKLCSYRQKYWWNIVLISYILCFYKSLSYLELILVTLTQLDSCFFHPLSSVLTGSMFKSKNYIHFWLQKKTPAVEIAYLDMEFFFFHLLWWQPHFYQFIYTVYWKYQKLCRTLLQFVHLQRGKYLCSDEKV